jgi:PAS domain S-box-containing protein
VSAGNVSGVGVGDRIVRALAAARTHGEAGEAVLQVVGEALGSPLGVLWTLDEASGLLRWEQDWAAGDDLAEVRLALSRLTFAPGVGLLGRVLATGEAAWVAGLASDPGFPRAEVLSKAGMRRVVASPLLSSDGALGVVEFFGRGEEPPTPEVLDAVGLAGRQLAGFVDRLRIEARLRTSEEASASIVQAALDCIITMDHRGRVLDFNPAAEATFGFERDAAVGQPLAELIVPPDLREAHRQAVADYVQDRVPRILGQRLELDGMRADGSTFPVELTVTRLGTREPPVFAGFIRDISPRRELELQQSRLLHDALQSRAEAEAAGVRAQSAREEAERAGERIALLAQAGRAMAESMDWETTLRAVVRSAVPAVADWAALTIVEPGARLSTLAVAHADPALERLALELVERYPPEPGDPHGPAHVIRTGEPETSADISPDLLTGAARDPEHLRLLQAIDLRHMIVAPLKTPAGVVGALSIALGSSGRSFNADDLDLITSLAARAALHVHNARLYTERSHIAQTLQASLRPAPVPDIPGADLAARFLPAGDQNEVGGDFFDVFPSGDGVWTAVVGDVAGKGAEAAAVTALARHTLLAASMVDDDPAENLALLNRAMHQRAPVDSFCTVFCARVRPSAAGIELRFSNGGHPSPMLLRADGSVVAVDAGRGPLVGGLEGVRYGEARMRLEPGELLLMYTDGVTEVRTSDIGLGERELRTTLAAHAGRPAEEVVAAVERRAVELQNGALRDDIALIAIRAPEEGAEGSGS